MFDESCSPLGEINDWTKEGAYSLTRVFRQYYSAHPLISKMI
jgi:hypothetical protein